MTRTILKPIKGKKIFDELFAKSSKFYHKDCLAIIRFIEKSNQVNPSSVRIIFYAVGISKKTARKAVIRNRVKRLLRESLKQLSDDNIQLFDNLEYLVIMWKWAPANQKLIRLNDVKPSVEKVLRNVQNQFSKNKTG